VFDIVDWKSLDGVSSDAAVDADEHDEEADQAAPIRRRRAVA